MGGSFAVFRDLKLHSARAYSAFIKSNFVVLFIVVKFFFRDIYENGADDAAPNKALNVFASWEEALTLSL